MKAPILTAFYAFGLMIAGLAATSNDALAAIIDLDLQIEGTGFIGSPPVLPLEIDVSITFDNSTSITTPQTAGITLNSINTPFDFVLAYTYDSVLDQLSFGGLEFGIFVTLLRSGTNNFFAIIDDISTTPTYNRTGYVTVAPAFNGSTPVGTVTVASTAVPEPGTLAVLGAGVLGAFAVRKKRRSKKET